MKALIGIVLILISSIIPGVCIVKNIHFQQECAGYLKQAADANTIELAHSRLVKALDYIENHNLTEGYTSVLWRTEDENIGYWYQNIKACKGELEQGIGGTQLEKANILMKVRESLTDNGESGTTLTIPKGIAKYPDNLTLGGGLWLSLMVFILGICLLSVKLSEWAKEYTYW